MPDSSRSPEDEEAIEKIRNLMRKVDSDPRIKAAVREALKKVGAWKEPETLPEPPPTVTYPVSQEAIGTPDPRAPGSVGTFDPPPDYAAHKSGRQVP